ncbi:hypothetical protein HDU76_002262 [Blyttiomyces sp. JEL0837]|nr:hypothetical protein HDU76_002262 [Blyttiomyces sp. JEL0837]
MSNFDSELVALCAQVTRNDKTAWFHGTINISARGFVFYNAKRRSEEDVGDMKIHLDALYTEFPVNLLNADVVQGWICVNFVTVSRWQDVRPAPGSVRQMALLTETAASRFDAME